MRLAENVKIHDLHTTAQLFWGISLQLRYVSGKKFVKQQYLLNISSQYGVLRPTND